LCESVIALHFHCLFSPRAWLSLTDQSAVSAFTCGGFFNQRVDLTASLDAKAAEGELFPKTRGLNAEAECPDRAGQTRAEAATVTGRGQNGIVPGKL